MIHSIEERFAALEDWTQKTGKFIGFLISALEEHGIVIKEDATGKVTIVPKIETPLLSLLKIGGNNVPSEAA
jgi:hypothetical protein